VRLRERFRALVLGVAAAADDAALGKARALSGVARFPARVKCALLGWSALERGLDEAIAGPRARSTDASTEGR
jgi:nitrogen fixation NifU-like protein